MPKEVHVLFCNTGCEHWSTLDFVHRCEVEWDVNIIWLELDWQSDKPTAKKTPPLVVNYETASGRKDAPETIGRPFSALLESKGNYLPNVVTRFCTEHMKIDLMTKYLSRVCGREDLPLSKTRGIFTEFVGIRADEPRRAAKIKEGINNNRPPNFGRSISMPLFDSGITAAAVNRFWVENSFTLNLPTVVDGTTLMGNCTMCFLKGKNKKMQIIDSLMNGDAWDKAMLDWWIRQEDIEKTTVGRRNKKSKNMYFTSGMPLKLLVDKVANQGVLNFPSEPDIPCGVCGD